MRHLEAETFLFFLEEFFLEEFPLLHEMPSVCPSLLLVTGFTEGGGLCMEDSRKHCSQPYLNEVDQMEENMTMLHLG